MPPAGTGIAGRYQQEMGGEHASVPRADKADVPVLQYLAQRLQCPALELRKLVQQQHTAVG